jgi:hypothetical protein
MCYEYDEFFLRARIAKQLRRNKEAAVERQKQSSTAAPAKPAESERRVKDKEPDPVPA